MPTRRLGSGWQPSEVGEHGAVGAARRQARIIWLLVADPTGCELIATTAVLGVLWGLATLHARVAGR
ncbi:MAG: hypothetical protein K0S98_2975 [Propionibacteriaceae bacterium]|jgi:hypothetical protein|nr:hypothetical protein [Propionibacteriaceae bacterium]